MNKKIVGFVLAMCLTVCLGSSSWALTDLGKVGDGFSGNAKGGITITMSENGGSDSNSMKNFADQTKGNLVTVFGYAAGVMTYAVNKTSIQFYDSNGMRATYSVAKGVDGNLKYTLSQINLSSADFDAINACQEEYKNAIATATDAGKKKDLEDMGLLGYFLTKKLGIAKSALKTVRTNNSGQILDEKGDVVKDSKNAEMVYAAWLTDKNYGEKTEKISAISWLGGGVNHSLSITLGGSDPQITLSENGKQNAIYGSFNGKAYIAAKYNYNDAGFLTSVDQIALEEKTSSGADNGNAKVTLEQKHTTLHFNSLGQQYFVTDSVGEKILQYEYTSNGSILSQKNLKTGDTTWYSGGVASYVTNKEGSITTQYFYKNGIMEGLRTYSNGQVVSTIACDDFGRQLGPVKGDVSFASAKKQIEEVLAGKADLSSTKVEQIYVYKDYVGVYDSFLGKNENVDFKVLANSTYGYNSPIAQISIAEGKTPSSRSIVGDYTYVKSNGEWRLMTDAEKEKYLKDGKLTADGKKDLNVANDSDLKTIKVGSKQAKDNAGKKYNYVTITKEDAEWLEKNMKTGKLNYNKDGNYINPENATKFFSALGVDNAGGSVSKQTKVGEGIKDRLSSDYTTPGYTASLTVTCLAQGISVKQVTTYIGKSEGGSTKIDPAVVGTVARIETVDGKQYAVLNNAQVDILNGNGFQSADGEEFYVCIDGLDDKPEVGATFAAAGYIDTSVDGHYAINNVYASEISSDTIYNMVQSFSATLSENATYQENLASNMITFAKAAADGKPFKNWQEGWALLIEYGAGAPANF